MTLRNEKTDVVSFRAPPDLVRQIDDARKAFGAGRGEWVRGVVTAHIYALEGPAHELMTEFMDRVIAELRESRKDTWRALLISLVHDARLSKEEAAELIRPYMRSL